MSSVEKLTALQLDVAVGYMLTLSDDGPDGPTPKRLPYDAYPGQSDKGIIPLLTREAWEGYVWNPPMYLPVDIVTGDWDYATYKPTWEEVVEWSTRGTAVILTKELHIWCQQEICARIFQARDLIDEVHNHLQGNYTADQYNLRERVKGKYQFVKQAIANASTPDGVDDKYDQGRMVITNIVKHGVKSLQA